MEEKNKAIFGCTVFILLILAIGIGGYVYTFKNETNILIWTTKKDIQLSAEIPYLLTGTIAAHQELNNIKITKITRCNIIERH